MDRYALLPEGINTLSAAAEDNRRRGADELWFYEVLMTHLADHVRQV
ncbi:unnamed protein product [Dibothriocephalus latus]|uniref:Uncharacterized protein n=1 Tax=Dibothriocephalus latus TaxID=60516 RepID=A0A3P7N8Z8_DIBLA|nr:unnamed protein product [Dibothriocephalus latus]